MMKGINTEKIKEEVTFHCFGFDLWSSANQANVKGIEVARYSSAGSKYI